MLQIRKQRDSHATMFILEGQLDYHSTAGLTPLILEAKDLGCPHIILEFSQITGIDTVGLGQLFLWYHKLHPYQLKLSIVNPSPRIRDILKQSRISELVPLYGSQQEAMLEEALPG